MNKRGAYQKKALNIANLHARHNLLVSALKKPVNVPKLVIPSLAGQRAFAALTIPKLKISPMALNTMKSLAEELYVEPDGDGNTGFAYLDALRIQAKTKLEGKTTSRSAEAKAKRAEDRQSQILARLQAVELINIQRSKAYFDLYSKVNALVKEADLEDTTRMRLFNMLDNHHATFSSLFAPDLDDGECNRTVVPLRFRKDR